MKDTSYTLSTDISNDNNDKNDKNKNEILNHSGGFSASRGSKILGVSCKSCKFEW